MSGTEKKPEAEEKKVSEAEKKVSEKRMDKAKNAKDFYNLNNAVRRASDVLKSVALGRGDTERGEEEESSSDTVQNDNSKQ